MRGRKDGGGWFLSCRKNKAKKEDTTQEFFVVPEKFNRKKPIFINDNNIGQYKFRHCCHPIPGDDILGFIDNKQRIEIHKRDCPVANKLKTSYGNRILMRNGTCTSDSSSMLRFISRVLTAWVW